MNLTKRDKTLLKILIVVVLIYVIISIFIRPIRAKNDNLEIEVSNLKARYETLKSYNLQKDKLLEEINDFKSKLNELDTLIPPTLTQDKIICNINKMEQSTGIQFENITFEIQQKPQESETTETNTQGNDEANTEDNKVADVDNNVSNTESNIPVNEMEAMCIVTSSNIKFTYEELKKFLQYVYDFDSKITIEEINITNSEESSDMLGTLKLNF